MLRLLRQSAVLTGLLATALLLSADSVQANDQVVGECNICNQGGRCNHGGRHGRGGRQGRGGLVGLGHHGQRGTCVNCRPYQYGNPDLFANYYVPGNCGGDPASMYVAPLPVPSHVGHTYYTYQPFMPHEMLYRHYRSYHRYYDGGRGLTRTKVTWW